MKSAMGPQLNVVHKIRRTGLCAGCGLCESIAGRDAISIAFDGSGYLRPEQHKDISADREHLIEEVCPGLHLEQTSDTPIMHPIWGPLVEVGTGHASAGDLRHHASSGGVISAVLTYLLESGSVDFIVQTAVSEDSPILNAVFESSTADQIQRAAGSRYAPSAPLSALDAQLERNGRFAFVGKPCDVAALRAYAKHDPRVEAKIPYVISFFCAGIPSLHGTKEILSQFGLTEQEVETFRYRGEGWPGYTCAMTRDGRKFRMSYAESWGGILTHQLQFRCKICPDGTGGLADLVCADAWYGDASGYPTFSEADGRSLIIARTTAGAKLIEEARERGYIITSALDIAEIEKMQPYQARRKRLILSRIAAMRVMGQTTPVYLGFTLLRAAATAGLLANARSFLGMVRRIVLRRT